MIKAFMRATRRGTDYTIENPDEAWELFCQQMPLLRNPIYEKVCRHRGELALVVKFGCAPLEDVSRRDIKLNNATS